MDEVQREYARARVRLGLRMTGPYGLESKQRLEGLDSGSKVLVFREKPKQWMGPFRLIYLDGETCVIQTEKERELFRTTAVKPYIESTEIISDSALQVLFASGAQAVHNTGCSLTKVVDAANFPDRFAESRKKELQGLMDRGNFRVVNLSEAHGHRLFGTRFVDALKDFGEQGEYEKSRLVVQAYNDAGSRHILTSALTCQRLSQRLVLALAAMFPNMTIFSRDITQADTQATTELTRRVFVRAPKEAGLNDDQIFEVLLPLYGLPESGLHWFNTYQSHHRQNLGMTPSYHDPCLLYRFTKQQGLEGCVVLQVDDSLGLGTTDFLMKEEMKSSRFIGKPRAILDRSPMGFNGITIVKQGLNIVLHQKDKLSTIDIPKTADDFISSRAKGSYIATCTRPDLTAGFQLLTTTTPTEKQFKALRNQIAECAISSKHEGGLRFVPLDLATLRILLFTDASFASAENYSSQLGCVIALSDASGAANIIHWFSIRSKRITRSAAAAELYALVHGYDMAYVLSNLLEGMLGRRVPVCALTDSRILFESITRLNTTAEKRLLIDLFALRQSYDHRELEELVWIRGGDNVADALTKRVSKPNALTDLMRDNKLQVTQLGMVQRSLSL